MEITRDVIVNVRSLLVENVMEEIGTNQTSAPKFRRLKSKCLRSSQKSMIINYKPKSLAVYKSSKVKNLL